MDGGLSPAVRGVPVVIEPTDEDGRSQVHPAVTDERGRWHSRELVAATQSAPVDVELEG